MTRIDFYQLDPARHQVDQMVCQLCQKAYDSQQHTLLLTRDPGQSEHFDQRLWTWRDDSFLPHDRQEVDGMTVPILIHDSPQARGDRHLLINLSDQVPEFFTQFERVLEFITEDNKMQAREHYRYYKERGYPLKHHPL